MKSYDSIPLLPHLIAETVCQRPYTGEEWSASLRDSRVVSEVEALRQKMTPQDIAAFADYADQWCRAAFTVKAEWFMKCVRSRTNRGRDQMYIWVAHWLSGWLKDTPAMRAKHLAAMNAQRKEAPRED